MPKRHLSTTRQLVVLFRRCPRLLGPLSMAIWLCACTEGESDPDPKVATEQPAPLQKDPKMIDPTAGLASSAVVTGRRETMGNAVDCPTLRSADGQLHPVSGLTSDIAIGQMVRVTGTYGVTTRCKGRVLVISDITLIDK